MKIAIDIAINKNQSPTEIALIVIKLITVSLFSIIKLFLQNSQKKSNQTDGLI